MFADPETLAKSLWRAYSNYAGATSPVVIRQFLPADEAGSLPRAWEHAGAGFGVALANGPRMQRSNDHKEAELRYAEQPRTRLYESVHTRVGEWQSLVSAWLASWLDKEVLSSAYAAEAADAALPEHQDAWHNIVLQLEGSKRWSFGSEQTVLNAGDLLIVPTGVMHYVRTDSHSVHINFEVIDPDVVAEYMKDTTPIPHS